MVNLDCGPVYCRGAPMKASRLLDVSSRRNGFTLLELIVVLALLALGAAIVGPGLLSSLPDEPSEARALIGSVRAAAVRRGETVRLQIDRSGAWQALVGTPPQMEVLMSGQLTTPPSSVMDLLFSSIGTCAPSVESAPAEVLATLDPLTCEPPS